MVTPTVESTESTLDSTVASSTLSESTIMGGTTAAANANGEATTNGMPEGMEMTSTPSESTTMGVVTTTSTDDGATTIEILSSTVPETTADGTSQVSTHQTITNGINTEDPIQIQTQGQTPGSVAPNVVTMATAADDAATQPSRANTCVHSGIAHF